MTFIVEATILAYTEPERFAACVFGVAKGTQLPVEQQIVRADAHDVWIRSGAYWYPVEVDGYWHGKLV